MNRIKMMKRGALLLMSLPLGAVPLTTFAALPADSPYVTDPQNTYVQDATSDGISNLNMVLCIMNSMDPAAMVNKGNYVALVDKNKCDSRSQSSTSNSTSGATGATASQDYMTAVVNITRASDSDPMIGKVWMSMTEEGQQMTVYVHLTATQSPTDDPPYGQFRVDYIGKSGGTTMFNGFVDANGADVKYLETGANSDQNSLAMTATSTSAGAGTMNAIDQNTQQPVTFNFSYDPDYFQRDDGSNDVCFDRSKANAQRSVWQYGTYNAVTGERVDQAHPGFPVQASYNGQQYYGFAAYWGINFQGLDLNAFPNGVLSGVTVTDQRPDKTGVTYALSKNNGRLTKWTQEQAKLSDMDGVPFTFWGDLSGLTDQSLTGFNGWQMKWDNANQKFVVIGTQQCGNTGCVISALGTPANVTADAFDNMPISGWSDSFGGNINIPPTASPHGSNDDVDYYTQADVLPGDANAPTALYCLSNCPTTQSLSDFVSDKNVVNGTNSPYDPTTAVQWNSGTVSKQYTFNSQGLSDGGGVLAVSSPDAFSGQYQNGIMTGRLFDAPLPTTGCPNGGTVCEPANPSVYYTWQTGPNPWNQSLWLTHNGTVVTFDPPENVAYTVPSDSATYGSWAGKHLQLQFDGFGNLQGIPGACVSSTDNSPVDCSVAGARYVPAFALPDGATMTLTSSNTPLIVKGLNAELRLATVSCSSTGMAQPQTVAGMPTAADVHDPSDAADPDYIGTQPTVTDPPAVIDGVQQ